MDHPVATERAQTARRARSSGRRLPLLGTVFLLSAAVIAGGCGDSRSPLTIDGGELAGGAQGGMIGVVTDLPGDRIYEPGQLIVDLPVGASPEALNQAFGMTTLSSVPELGAFLLACPDNLPIEELEQLIAGFPGVEAVERNWHFQTPEAEQRSLAFDDGSFTHDKYIDQHFLDRIGAAAAHTTATGAGVLIAVLDTGVAAAHPDLAGRIAPGGYDFVDDDEDPEDEVDGIDQDGDGLIDEAAGHGTHVTGLALLVAPDARIVPVRVLDTEGWGKLFAVIEGVAHAVSAGADVVNMSFGMDGQEKELRLVLEHAADLGVVLVASSGNQARNAPNHYPAAYRAVTAVAATDADDRLASFSNYGPHIDLCAPGVGLLSTYLNGSYARWSGTSMAAPLVAGAAALLLELAPDSEPGELITALCNGADDIGELNPGRTQLIGAGRLNLNGAVLAF